MINFRDIQEGEKEMKNGLWLVSDIDILNDCEMFMGNQIESIVKNCAIDGMTYDEIWERLNKDDSTRGYEVNADNEPHEIVIKDHDSGPVTGKAVAVITFNEV